MEILQKRLLFKKTVIPPDPVHRWEKYAIIETQLYRHTVEDITNGSTVEVATSYSSTWYSDIYFAFDSSGTKEITNTNSSAPSTVRVTVGSGTTGTAGAVSTGLKEPYGSTGYRKIMGTYETTTLQPYIAKVTKVSAGTDTEKGSYITDVTSTNRNEYPDNSYTGGYWYVYLGLS